MVENKLINLEVKYHSVTEALAALDKLQKTVDKLNGYQFRNIQNLSSELEKIDQTVNNIQEASGYGFFSGTYLDKAIKKLNELDGTLERIEKRVQAIGRAYNTIANTDFTPLTGPASTPESRRRGSEMKIAEGRLLPRRELPAPGYTDITHHGAGTTSPRSSQPPTRTMIPYEDSRANKDLVDIIKTVKENEKEAEALKKFAYEIYLSSQMKGRVPTIPFSVIKNPKENVDDYVIKQYEQLEKQGINVDYTRRGSYNELLPDIRALVNSFNINNRDDLKRVMRAIIDELETYQHPPEQNRDLLNVLNGLENIRRFVDFDEGREKSGSMYKALQRGRTAVNEAAARFNVMSYDLGRTALGSARPKVFIPGSVEYQQLADGLTHQSYAAAGTYGVRRGEFERMGRNVTKYDLPPNLWKLDPLSIFSYLKGGVAPLRLTEFGRERRAARFGFDRNPEDEYPQLDLDKMHEEDMSGIKPRGFALKPVSKPGLNEYYPESDTVVRFGPRSSPNLAYRILMDPDVSGLSNIVAQDNFQFQQRAMLGRLHEIHGKAYAENIHRNSDELYQTQKGMIPDKEKWDSVSPLHPDYMKTISHDVAGYEKFANDAGLFYGSPQLMKFVRNAGEAREYLEQIGKVLSYNVLNMQKHADYVGISRNQIINIMRNVNHLFDSATPILQGIVPGTQDEMLAEMRAAWYTIEKGNIAENADISGFRESNLQNNLEAMDQYNSMKEEREAGEAARKRNTWEEYIAKFNKVAAAGIKPRMALPEFVEKHTNAPGRSPETKAAMRQAGMSLSRLGRLVPNQSAVPSTKLSEVPDEGTYEPGHWYGLLDEDRYNWLLKNGWMQDLPYHRLGAEEQEASKKKIIDKWGSLQELAKAHGVAASDKAAMRRIFDQEHQRGLRARWNRMSREEKVKKIEKIMKSTALINRVPRGEGKPEFDAIDVDRDLNTTETSTERRYREIDELFQGWQSQWEREESDYEDEDDIQRQRALAEETVLRSVSNEGAQAYRKHSTKFARRMERLRKMFAGDNTSKTLIGFGKKIGKAALIAGGILALNAIAPGIGGPLGLAGLGIIGAVDYSKPGDEIFRDIDIEQMAINSPDALVKSKARFGYDPSTEGFSADRVKEFTEKMRALGYEAAHRSYGVRGESDWGYSGTASYTKEMTAREAAAESLLVKKLINAYSNIPGFTQSDFGYAPGTKKKSKVDLQAEARKAATRQRLAGGLAPAFADVMDLERVMNVTEMSRASEEIFRKELESQLGGLPVSISSGKSRFDIGRKIRTLKISAKGVRAPAGGNLEAMIDAFDAAIAQVNEAYNEGRQDVRGENTPRRVSTLSKADAWDRINAIRGPVGAARGVQDRISTAFGEFISGTKMRPRVTTTATFHLKDMPDEATLSKITESYGRLGHEVKYTTSSMDDLEDASGKTGKTLLRVSMANTPEDYKQRKNAIDGLTDAFASVTGAEHRAVQASHGYGRSLQFADRAGDKFTKSANAFKSMAWSMTFLNMSFLGVAFSMQGLASMFMRALTTLFNPIMDLNSIFESLGMVMAFGDEQAQAFIEGMNPEDIVKAWENLQVLLGIIAAGFAKIGIELLTDDDFVARVQDGLIKLFDALSKPENIQAFKDIILALVDALPDIVNALPYIADFIKLLSGVNIGDKSLLSWLAELAVLSPFILPTLSLLSGFFTTISSALGVFKFVVMDAMPYLWAFVTWLSEGLAKIVTGLLVKAGGLDVVLASTIGTIIGGIVGGLMIGLGTVFIMLKLGLLDRISDFGKWIAEIAKDNPIIDAWSKLVVLLGAPFAALGAIIIDILSGQSDKILVHLKMIGIQWVMTFTEILAGAFARLPFDLGKGQHDALMTAWWAMQGEYSRLQAQAPLLQNDYAGQQARSAQEVRDQNAAASQWMMQTGGSYDDWLRQQSAAVNATAPNTTNNNTQNINIGSINTQTDLDDFYDKLATINATRPGATYGGI